MNSEITTLDPVTTPANFKTILSKEGFTCSLLILEPGRETPMRESHEIEEHILFVVEGEAIVRFDTVNTILSKDGALLIQRGKAHVIAANTGHSAKILRVDVPESARSLHEGSRCILRATCLDR